MDNKILEILLNMQSKMDEMSKEIKLINSKLDKIEFKMKDGFETLELLGEKSSSEINRIDVKVSKLENRLREINPQ